MKIKGKVHIMNLFVFYDLCEHVASVEILIYTSLNPFPFMQAVVCALVVIQPKVSHTFTTSTTELSSFSFSCTCSFPYTFSYVQFLVVLIVKVKPIYTYYTYVTKPTITTAHRKQ